MPKYFFHLAGQLPAHDLLVRLMVQQTDPRLGETVLDPASGTGGFLVEAFNHLSSQVKTVADRKTLQTESLSGCEAKPLPYLLCQMNLLLHGLDAPQIDPNNALSPSRGPWREPAAIVCVDGPLLSVDLSSAVRASLRRRSNDELDDGVPHRWQLG